MDVVYLTAFEYLTMYECGLLAISLDQNQIVTYFQRCADYRWRAVKWMPKRVEPDGTLAYPEEMWRYLVEDCGRYEDLGEHGAGACCSTEPAQGHSP